MRVISACFVVLAACGSSTARHATSPTTATSTSTTSVTVPPAGAPARPGPESTTTRPVTPSTSASPTSTGNAFSPPSSLPPGDFTTRVSFEKPCLEPGGSQHITVSTEAGAAVAYTVLYADRKNHGGNSGGIADSHGKFRDVFVVASDAPRGAATAYVVVTTSDHRQSNATGQFRVGC